ncbi:MAG TPA: hypothetical protein VNX68_07945, partial [Nitrosopumilaceae archaeon]|nr:hypothetical protein [Nitrosopumilaceae archaeon]
MYSKINLFIEMQKWIFRLALFLVIILYSCGNDRLKVDVSNIEFPQVRINRLEKDIFSMDPQAISRYSPEMLKKYGNFYNNFIYNVINHGETPDSVFRAVSAFIKDPDIKDVYSEVVKKFPDTEIDKISMELTQAFKYFKWHFPTEKTPFHYATYVSGFEYNFLPVDSTLGIGLDMYL